MELRLGCPGTDGAPREQVGDVLRGDGVEELGANRNAEVGKCAK